jgi:outer membrane protein assembly factor BamB
MKHFFFLLILSSVFTLNSFSAEWPQWRGPQRDGRVAGETVWPSGIGTNELKEIWRVEVGPSYSGPIVSDDRVFTTETRDEKFEVVRALDRSTGQELWISEWEGAMKVPFFAKSNGSWIRSTPAIDGERLYVAGMREVLVCIDARDGSEIWRKDFVSELKTPLPDFGFVCSPLVDGPAVFVQAGAGLAKLDKLTGEILWRSSGDNGGMWDSAFSSPIIAELGGMRQLVIQTREKLIGVNIDSGSILWEQPVQAFRGMNILTPVVHRDMVFTSTYGGKTIGFKVDFQGDAFVVEEAWRHKAQGYMSTPVVINGIAYEHLKSQRLMAIDVISGQEYWTSDQSFGKYVSLVANGDQILALDQRGELFLVRANKEKLTILDQRKLTDAETWAHLAVADDEIFVRELNALVAYRWRNDESPDVATR